LRALRVIEEGACGDGVWNDFCREHGWFWHTTRWRDYTLAYRPEANARSLAFALGDDDGVRAVVPLMREERDGAMELSFGGGACWAPAIERTLGRAERAAVLRRAMEEIDSRAEAEGAGVASLQLSPLGPAFEADLPVFLGETARAGWSDRSLATQVLPLDDEPEELRAGLSTNHRRSLAKAERELEVTVSEERTALEELRRLHLAASGRQTRPDETWELMGDWLADGHGAVAVARADGRALGAIYVLAFGEGAYYASGANHPEAGRLPVGHALHWGAALWLRGRGLRRYELGLQQFGPLAHDLPSTKELGIARFKRGFGGLTLPLAVRERFYDPDAAAHTVRERAAALEQTLLTEDPE
jgi:hypothetical protein